MKFADFVATGAIRANLEAQDKEGVIREIVGCAIRRRQDCRNRACKASSRRS